MHIITFADFIQFFRLLKKEGLQENEHGSALKQPIIVRGLQDMVGLWKYLLKTGTGARIATVISVTSALAAPKIFCFMLLESQVFSL